MFHQQYSASKTDIIEYVYHKKAVKIELTSLARSRHFRKKKSVLPSKPTQIT